MDVYVYGTVIIEGDNGNSVDFACARCGNPQYVVKSMKKQWADDRVFGFSNRPGWDLNRQDRLWQ